MTKEIKRLAVSDIAKLPNVPTKEVIIQEWGVSLLLQGITKAKQVELAKLVEDKQVDAFDYQKILLKFCVIEPKLQDKDIDELYEKDSKIIDIINSEIAELNGFGGSAQADEFQE